MATTGAGRVGVGFSFAGCFFGADFDGVLGATVACGGVAAACVSGVGCAADGACDAADSDGDDCDGDGLDDCEVLGVEACATVFGAGAGFDSVRHAMTPPTAITTAAAMPPHIR